MALVTFKKSIIPHLFIYIFTILIDVFSFQFIWPLQHRQVLLHDKYHAHTTSFFWYFHVYASFLFHFLFFITSPLYTYEADVHFQWNIFTRSATNVISARAPVNVLVYNTIQLVPGTVSLKDDGKSLRYVHTHTLPALEKYLQ